MKCRALLLFVGVLFSCFYLECKAFNYRDLRQNGRSSLLEAESTIDQVRYHRSRRDAGDAILTNQTDCQNDSSTCQLNDTSVKENHKYYVSEVKKNGQKYWIDVQGNPKHQKHDALSDSYLLRQNYKLSFQFPYYGHLLDQVMLTTGGFLYMDTHDTKLMTQVQYLAPLMAYFNPHLTRESKVFTLDDGSKLTVEWHKVHLHVNTTVGPFTFQCTLHKDGTIWFAYKQIPVKVEDLPALTYHPVKVGIADAFVIRYKDKRDDILYRFFYIYSTINITKESVVNNAAVVFKPQPSCVSAKSCISCMERTAETNFTCQWCPKIERCSDKVDRHREEWERNKCSDNSIKEGPRHLSGVGKGHFLCLPKEALSSPNPTQHNRTEKAPTMSEECLLGGKKEQQKKGLGGGAIFGIVLILLLVIGIAAWCVYAYKRPTSKSGLFLIEATRRPRNFFKKSPGVTGNMGDAAPSDVKPQVL